MQRPTGDWPFFEQADLASTRTDGAETVATLVTVLRDCVLALILGAGFLAAAHISA